jgi:hypothetical protein
MPRAGGETNVNDYLCVRLVRLCVIHLYAVQFMEELRSKTG